MAKRLTGLRPLLIAGLLVAFVVPGAGADTRPELKLGMVGLDTSHVVQFVQLLNDPANPNHVPGARVVAAYKGGSPDVEESASRIERFTAELQTKWGVELVPSIEELCRKVDAVLLMSVDGRTHLAQVRPVFAAKKLVFIDKPFAGNFKDAAEIVRLSSESGTPFFSCSGRRFSDAIQTARKDPSIGEITGAFSYGPAPIKTYMPDMFWYGIHSIEALFTLMGPGCESVARFHSVGADVLVGRWKDGRLGVVRAMRDGDHSYGATVFGSKAVVEARTAENQPKGVGYSRIVAEIVKFFQTRVPPVSAEETLEIMAFMEAADLSKARDGQAVALKEVLDSVTNR